MNLVVLIVTAVFLCLGIIQLFVNFDVSFLVTIVLTAVVGVLYFRADKQAKAAQDKEKAETEQVACETIEVELNEAEEDNNNEQGQTTENT